MFKDITGLFGFNALQVAQNNNVPFDTHHPSDAIWFACLNGTNTNFELLDDKSNSRGVIPRYSSVQVLLDPRPINVQFSILGAGNVVQDVTTTQATPNSSGAAATQTITIGGVPGATPFLNSILITGDGATAATTVTATIIGAGPSQINIPVSVPAGATVPITPTQINWPNGGLVGTLGGTITITLPSFGAGNLLQEVEAVGGTVTAISGTLPFLKVAFNKVSFVDSFSFAF